MTAPPAALSFADSVRAQRDNARRGVDTQWPPRDARVRGLLELIGPGNPDVRPLANGIRRVARAQFDAHVLPEVQAHWPDLIEHPFYEKLVIGTCDLYASAPYVALLCAPRRPPLIRLVSDVGAALPLPASVLARLGGASMMALGRLAFAAPHRRIVLIAAFIVVVDHVFDHVLTEPPRERQRRLLAVLRGGPMPDSPPLRLLHALSRAMQTGLSDAERPAFDAAMAKVSAWIEAEVLAMLGEPDPAGLGHRLAGIEGTIDGLLFPVVTYGGEGARQWMYSVSMFVQIADDWLDLETDRTSDRSTPVLTGEWTFRDVELSWRRSVMGIEDLVRGAGLGAPRYVEFIRQVYVLMMRDVVVAMAERPSL